MRNLTYAFLAFVLITSCAKKPQTISGDIKNLDDAELIINKFSKTGIVEVAKTKAIEGKFSLEYSAEQPDMIYIKSDKINVPVFLDESSITVTGDADSPKEIVIEGSDTDVEFKAFEEIMIPMAEEQGELRQQYRDYSAKGDEENTKAIYAEFEDIQQKMVAAVKTQITENSTSYVSAFLANVYFGNSDNLEELKEMFNSLDKSLEGYSYYDEIKAKFETVDQVSIGKVAPDFTLNTPDGKPVSLSSFRGKYMLLDFWASWCGPCRRENPNVVAMYAKFGGDKFDILGISLDKTKKDWVKAIADDKLTWNHVSDLKHWKSEAAALYGVKGIPHTVLIDPDGVIIAKNLRGKALEEKLASLLK